MDRLKDPEALAKALWGAIQNLQCEGVALLDADGVYYALNPAHEILYGYHPGELVGESWRILYHPDQIARIESEFFPELALKGRWEGWTDGVKKDGTYIHAHVTLTAITEGDLAGGLLCICYDVTDSQLAREEIAYQILQVLGSK